MEPTNTGGTEHCVLTNWVCHHISFTFALMDTSMPHQTPGTMEPARLPTDSDTLSSLNALPDRSLVPLPALVRVLAVAICISPLDSCWLPRWNLSILCGDQHRSSRVHDDNSLHRPSVPDRRANRHN
jgi:hypothetical protein